MSKRKRRVALTVLCSLVVLCTLLAVICFTAAIALDRPRLVLLAVVQVGLAIVNGIMARIWYDWPVTS